MTVQYSADSYQGIIDAFNTLRAANAEDRKYYPPNFQGIIEAILDIKKWGQSGSGETPPGLFPIVDEDGNIIGSDFNPPPENGTLWFDERQGRLFIWMDDGFYQTNGGDGIPAVQEDPPEAEVPGSLWYNTSTGTLYIYDGETWTVVGGSTGATSTMNLPLANPTRNVLQQIISNFPDPSGLTTQADMNEWTIYSLKALDDAVGAANTDIPTFNINSGKPSNPVRGDYWFNTSKVELMLYYDGSWVPTSVPLLANDDFNALASTVTRNNSQVQSQLVDATSRLRDLEDAPLRKLNIDTDYNGSSLVLNDDQAYSSRVEFKGVNGIGVTAQYGCITIDGELLKQSVENLVNTSSNADAVESLSNRTSIAEQSIAALINEPRVGVSQFASLNNLVEALPTRAEFNQKVGMNDAVFNNDISCNNNQIKDVGAPADLKDVANKEYVDLLRTYVDNSFVNKNGSSLGNISINRADVNQPAIDFSSSPVDGMNALKFKTFGGPGTVSFGITANQNEYAWEFTGDEEFSWIGNAGKSATLNKEGLIAKSLVIGDFVRNNNNEQLVLNKIDVKERLTKTQTALHSLRTALVTATDFDEFKVMAHTALSNI